VTVADLKGLCRDRGWTRQRLVYELRRVAGQELPADESLVRMVRMWANGTRAPSEMYADLLGKAFGVQLNGYGPESDEPPTKEAVALSQATGAGCGVDWREGPRNAAQSLKQGIVDQHEEISMAAEESARFAALAEQTNVGPHTLDQFTADIQRIVTVYPNRPVYPLFIELRSLRDRIFEKLEGRQFPGQTRDLYLAAGVVGGVLANASFDLGRMDAAETQARTAFLCAELAGANWLRAWVRGTQALIAYWADNPAGAVRLAQDGQRYHPEFGTALVRLAGIQARAFGMLRDSGGVDRALGLADDTRSAIAREDEPGGMMVFTAAKQYCYAATSRLWLGEVAAARIAEQDAAQSVQDHVQQHPEDRRLGELNLARLDLVCARLAQDHLEGVANEVRSVLDVIRHRPTDSVTRRLRQVDVILGQSKFDGNTLAESVREEIRTAVASSARPAMPEGAGR
jgi:hypothetical protein